MASLEYCVITGIKHKNLKNIQIVIICMILLHYCLCEEGIKVAFRKI